MPLMGNISYPTLEELAMQKKPNSSRGFSLILSLTIMAFMTMLLLSLSAFTMIESRTAMNQQLAVRARLNGIASMRLALAHLQQTAGPDRRSTARADITQPGTPIAALTNPMWTGVWRTDLPDLPPAWLVSGRADQPAGAQSICLYQYPDYPDSYWVPWKTDPAQTAAKNVILVGTGSAAISDGIKPSGLISLPAVALPDTNVNGSFAYWIGDEGIKARVNLTDNQPRPLPSSAALDARAGLSNTANNALALRSPVATGFSVIPGLSILNLTSGTQVEQLANTDTIRNITSLDGFPTGPTGATLAKGLFHDISFVSAGVIADSLNGGLKRDLSLAFELPDNLFAATEFGEGATGAAATGTENGVEAKAMPVLLSGSKTINAAPVFSRITADGNLRGPTWWALRDYHRLYKQLGWSSTGGTGRALGTPSLNARTLWPNVSAAHPNGTPANTGLPNNSIRDRLYGYSDIYNGDLPAPINPNTSDFLSGDTGKIITRPLNVAASPYLQKLSLAFSVNKMQWFETTSFRIGRTLYTMTTETIDIRLNVTPIVVVHNPYNVAMTWSPANGGTNNYGACVSVSDMSGWLFRFKQYPFGSNLTPDFVLETKLSEFFRLQDPVNSNNDDSFRIYLTKNGSPTITLQPGEFRVFSCPPIYKDWTQSAVLDNTYDTRGGFNDNLPDWGGGQAFTDASTNGVLDITAPIAFEIIPGGNFRVRHALACWPGDQITSADNTENFFRNSSEQSELVVSNINPSQYPSLAQKYFPSWRAVVNKFVDGQKVSTGPTNQPDLVATIDVFAKSADTNTAPFPTLTHSNPMAATRRASGSGRANAGPYGGYTGVSPSFQFSLRNDPWENVLQFPSAPTVATSDVGKLAYGGYSMASAAGKVSVIQTEIPLVQPTSLAQYAHANFGVRDQQPLLSIGNSFASPLVSAQKVMQDNGSNWTEYDQSYLLNASLWDSFFLSGAAPQMATSNVSAASPSPTNPSASNAASNPHTNETKWLYATASEDPSGTKTTVIKDFVYNGIPLDNPRFTLTRSSRTGPDMEKALTNHRTSAAVLLNQGAFNVNSTSITAWQAFLGSTKNFTAGGLTASSPSASANARFVRALSGNIGNVAAQGMTDPTNWTGMMNLSDTQITNLAKAIVDENRARFSVLKRTERELKTAPTARLFSGLGKAATPYMGLSEFINRFLAPDTWASRCGALQAAILRADQSYNTAFDGKLSIKPNSPSVSSSSLSTATAGWFSNPENIEVVTQPNAASATHTAYGAPGNLLQSDLLAAFGSALATRSDTFTMRCYGDAANAAGEKGAAWMEVVVQRYPDFIDPTNVAETGSAAPRPLKVSGSAAADPTLSTVLTPLNNVLGRRFKVISMRWLKPDEI